MFIEIYKDAEALGQAEAQRIASLIHEKNDALLCLAAGQSTLCVFKTLTEMNRTHQVDFSKVKIVGLDEWCGFAGYEGSARWILDTSLFNQINLDRRRMRLFDANPADPEGECRAIEQYIAENGGIDYLLLGVGMNGHVGLNEPGADITMGTHVNQLAEKTREVSAKYFTNGMPPIACGQTLGFKNFFEARDIAVILNGEHKAPIVKKFMELPVTSEFPVTAMKLCERTRFVMDRGAAKDIYTISN